MRTGHKGPREVKYGCNIVKLRKILYEKSKICRRSRFLQVSKYIVLKVECKWSQKVLERLRTSCTVPQFNYMIKVRGLKGVRLIGYNCEKDKFRPTYNQLSRPTLFLLYILTFHLLLIRACLSSGDDIEGWLDRENIFILMSNKTFIFSQEVAEPLMDLKESIRELQNNETFKHILATLLAIGNFLNGKKVRASTIITATYSYDTFCYQCRTWKVK